MILRTLLAAMLLAGHFGTAQADSGGLIVNGDMSQTREGRQPFAGWDNWLWDGEGSVERFIKQGEPASAVIRNLGPAKQAIFQKLELAACSYRLTAEVAAAELAPNEDDRAATLHIAIENGEPSITHDVFRSDGADWHRLNLVFTLTRPSPAYLYFFNYGSGSYFVRNVGLKPMPGCKGENPSFALTAIPGARLAYEPPLTAADFVLSGYCGARVFRDRPFCTERKPEPERDQPAPTRLLTDFERHPDIFSSAVFTDEKLAIAGRSSARLVNGQYLGTSPSQGLPSDWTGHDWLRIDTFNATDKPVSVYVEINDDKTTGYWSRVNWTTAAPPGRSSIDVPLRTFVGEKSVIQERRRLDLRKITRLVLTATDGDLVIDNVRLEADPPFESAFPGLLAFDLGPATSPVMTGFTQLTADMGYAKRRGYGFAPRVRIGRIEDRRHPDDLFRDWVSILGGGLDIDLPNGRYRVWMMLEDPGYWEYYPSATQRRIFVQDKEIEGGIRPYSDFARRFWRHADDEDLPGDDIWKRYIEPRYRPLTTTAVVENGQLNLRFNGNGDPHAVPLSALIVFPESDADKGEAFLTELFSRLRMSYEREYRQVIPPVGDTAVATANALDGHLTVFTRSLALDTAANARPAASELATSFAVDVPGGLTATLVVGLLPKTGLGLVDAKLELPGLRTKLSSIRNKITRLALDGSVYAAIPRVIDPLRATTGRPLALPAGIARALLIEIEAEPDAAAGQVTAPLTLKFSDGRKLDLPITVAIKPWSLPAADIPIGYLGTATRYPLATYPEIAARRMTELKSGLSLLRRNGMTAVSGGLGGPTLVRYELGKPQIDVSDMRPSLAAIADAGYTEVLTYDGLAIGGLPTDHVSNTEDLYRKPYVAVLRDILQTVERERSLSGMRSIVHAIADEPPDAAIPAVVDVAMAFKKAQPSVRTAAFTSITDFDSDPRSRLAGLIDRLYLNLHSEAAIRAIIKAGSRCSLYNREGRYARGIYLLKMRDLGCEGHMQFAFNSAHVDHWYDLDGREGDQVAVFTHPDGMLRPSMDLIRYRQSIDDYRHLMLVDRMAAEATTQAAVAARKWLQALKLRMVVGAQSPFKDGELDEIRREAVYHIDAMAGSTGTAATTTR